MGCSYEEMYNMTLKELYSTLEFKRKGLAYKIWKQSYLITLGVSDLMRDKRAKAMFPNNPEEASPELYPQKPSIKKPDFLNNSKVKMKGDMMIYG